MVPVCLLWSHCATPLLDVAINRFRAKTPGRGTSLSYRVRGPYPLLQPAMALFTKLRDVNWPALGAEFVLVFAGVTLALWFENVNEDRREYEEETRILRELADALAADVRDIGANLREDSLTLASIDVVLNHMEQRLPYSGTLDPHFAQAAGLTVFIDNSAPYEHLKVAGLDVIRNDSLRLAIVDYYERLVQTAREWETWVALPVWQEHMNPQMLRQFRYSQRKEPAAPINYAALQRDVEYQNVLRHTSFAIGFKDRLYRRVATSAEALNEQIQQDLAMRH